MGSFAVLRLTMLNKEMKSVLVSINEVEYYYFRNAQGDIIGLFDKTGKQAVPKFFSEPKSFVPVFLIDNNVYHLYGIEQS